MKKYVLFTAIILTCLQYMHGQEIDLTYSTNESGTQSHYARNSITFGPGYTYTPSGGTLTAEIQDPVITGNVVYGATPVDPSTRTLNTSTYLVGATNGNFSVNAAGGASYTIPLEGLPGTNGLAPSLSLVYSSNSGSGIAGFGWQIGGLSVISRGPKTLYHDGITKGIDLDTTDRFYMDGQRLVNTNSYYGNSSAKYQTENDIITRVTPNGTVGNGPAWFSAQTKSGLIYEYGNTLGSKLILNGFNQVVNWYLSKISDLFGNQITFDYLQDNGSVYPAQMIYGPNKIIFYYKERTDKSYSYIKGVKIEQRLILDKIKVTYNNTILKTYEFKYNSKGDNYNTNSILNEVIEYGIGTSRLNSTAFTYQLPDNVAFSHLITVPDNYITYKSKLFSGDFNGDGKVDIFCLPDASKGATWTGWKLFCNNGTYFNEVSSGDFINFNETDIDRVNIMDINGDGLDDIVFNYLEGSYIYYYYVINIGISFSNTPIVFGAIPMVLVEYNRYPRANDIDGDGLPDYIDFRDYGLWFIYSYSSNLMQAKYGGVLGSTIEATDKLIVSDFNGDGKADLWKLNNSGLIIYTFVNGSLEQIYSSASPTKNHFFNLGDFNADGKTDIFLYGYNTTDMPVWQIRLSTGTGFETISIPQKKSNLKNDNVRQGDFNGDGCTDFMITANTDNGWTGHYYYISKNKGADFYSYYYSSGFLASYNYFINDYNGDGRDDYLCTDGVSPWFNGYTIFRSAGNNSILMDKIGNGLGNLTTLAYTKLSQASSSVYQRGTGAAFPVSDYQGPLTVVTSATFDNGIGSTNSQNYYYEGMKIHRQGKGLLGYAKTQVTDAASGIIAENTSTYNTTYFSPSITTSSKKLSGQPTAFETVTNTWSQRVLDAAKKRIFPYVQTSVQSNSLTQQSDTVKTTIGDDYGNATSIVKSYNNNVTETTTNTYNNNSTLWLLGRPITTSVQYSGGGSTITRSVNRVFGTSNNSVQSQTALPGNSLQVVHGYKYNANGTLQRDSVTASGACRKNSYTYDTYGIKMLTQMDALSHVSTNTYDTYGRFSQKQDYLGNTETYQFDNLSRQTSATRSDGSSTTTVYSWESPTTSFRTRYSIQITGNDGSVSKVWYDLLGREIRSDVKSFNGTFVYTSKQYNNKGQVSQVSESYFPSETAVWNVFSYDSYGRKTGVTTPSGRNSTWSYSGSTVIETTAGKTFTKTYASDGTMTSATDNGNTISYTYFPDGKVKTITAPGGIVTSMLYDLAGNQTQLTDPSAGVINYTYNGFGELTNQQNARSQNIQLTYLTDGRLQQKVTPEGTTTYSYNTNKQLTGISSPESISRSYSYDTKGRVTNTTETIAGSAYSTTFTYDNLGRPSTTSHPSGITETNNYNNYGYLASVSAGGSSRWTTLAMNNRGQITSGRYGASLTSTMNYNSYGYPTTVVTGSLRSYEYEFNPVTGNLNWRKNVLQSNIQENFEFDNLDRLDRIYRGSTTLLDMAYDANKGGITTKSDAGTFKYDFSLKPYALSDVDPSEGLIPEVPDSLTYTSFESIKTITEDEYHAAFVYNSDNERAKMDVQQNGTTILTRIYPTGNYLKETAGGVTKEYTFIGGDAYSAPCVAIKQQGGTTRFYYILRDHLGSITHVIDTTNTKLYEYSYDAWGRLRNTATWEAYAPGSEPALFIAGRGYTGHEHLPWFSLINMNGRVYDPLTGQFLNADNFNQAPDRLMGFNRYAYALNNPLLYTDPDGEFAWIPVIIGAIIGAYGGHEIAEAKGYDLGDWQGWAFMLGGAVIGGVSGGIGSEIMAGGGFMANTMSIAYSSTAYSIGMNALSGGMTDVNIGFGGFSYNITNNDWGYLGEKGNTTLANIGYGFGALANIQDIVAGFNGTTIDVKARPELSGHSQVEGPEILISVGPADVSIGQGEGLKWEMEYVKRSLKGNSVKGKNFAYIRPNQEQLVSQLYNVNGKWLSTMTDRLNSGNNLLNTGVLKYGLLKGCVNYTSRSLLFAGVVNLNAFLPVTAPVLLNAELFIRQMGIYASPFLINF